MNFVLPKNFTSIFHPTALLTAAAICIGLPFSAGAQEESKETSSTPTVEAAAPEAQTNCRPNAVATKSDYDGSDDGTTSTTFVNMPNMKVRIKPSKKGCVIVNLSVEKTVRVENMAIQVKVTKMGPAGISNPFWVGPDDSGNHYRADTYQFVVPDVPAGKRKVKVQFRCYSETAGCAGGVGLYDRNVTVHYTN